MVCHAGHPFFMERETKKRCGNTTKICKPTCTGSALKCDKLIAFQADSLLF